MPKIQVVEITPVNNKLAVTLTDGKDTVRCDSVIVWPAAKVSDGALESLFNYWKMRAAASRIEGQMFLPSDMQPHFVTVQKVLNHTLST